MAEGDVDDGGSQARHGGGGGAGGSKLKKLLKQKDEEDNTPLLLAVQVWTLFTLQILFKQQKIIQTSISVLSPGRKQRRSGAFHRPD